MIRSDDEGNDGQRSASPTGSSDANHNLKSGKESDTFLSVRDDTSSSSSSHSSADVESNLSAPPRPSVTPTERHDEALTEAVDAHQLTNHRGFPDVRQQRIRSPARRSHGSPAEESDEEQSIAVGANETEASDNRNSDHAILQRALTVDKQLISSNSSDHRSVKKGRSKTGQCQRHFA